MFSMLNYLVIYSLFQREKERMAVNIQGTVYLRKIEKVPIKTLYHIQCQSKLMN